jgi:UDP-N-acetylmuramoylalanine--D-glutamate ligase
MSDNFLNNSFAILGAGRSGFALAKFLSAKGAKVFLSDENSESKLKYIDVNVLDKMKIGYEFGGHSHKVYGYDVIVKSPGIPMEAEVILNSIKNKKKVYGEVEVAYRFCPCPVIAITGTNGKTTTTILTGEIFKNAGFDVKVCGNVGLAFSEVLNDLTEKSIVVLETSSYQLESTDKFKPAVSIFLNFTEDHLIWHKTMENYFRSKMKIAINQDEYDLFIFNYDDEYIKNNFNDYSIKADKAAFTLANELIDESLVSGCYLKNDAIYFFNNQKNELDKIINIDEVFIKGRHNIANAMASIITAKRFNIPNEVIKNTLQTFKGVEHRIEFVRELNGVKYYNDSKATNIDSALVGIESFDKNIILIMGGQDMEVDFTPLKQLVSERVKQIIAIGESKNKIYEFFNNKVNTVKADSLEVAVDIANKKSSKDDVVLFSPAFKSFDMFENFEHRGKEFKKFVNNLS